MLLTLVTAINNDGQPRCSNDPPEYSGPFEENLQPRDRVLNALTTLLVRTNEVVAVNKSYKVLALRLASTGRNEADTDESDITKSSESATLQPRPTVIAVTDDYHPFVDNLLLVVEKGASHIGEHFGNWDELLAIPKNDPFPNHVATVEDFLHKFGMERSKSLTANFSRYIVATCWEKMHQRITHWSSRDIIRFLSIRVNRAWLLDMFDHCKFSCNTRQDSKLAGLLIGKETNDENVLDILKRLCPDDIKLPDLRKLVAAFESMRALPLRTPGTGWYTKHTCFEFHNLLVCSLIAYGNSLRILYRAHSRLKALQAASITPEARSDIDRLMGMMPKYAEQVLRCSCLLWRITDSWILRHHFKLLQTCHRPFGPYHPRKEAVGETKVFGRITEEWTVEAVSSLDDDRAHDQVDQGRVEEDDQVLNEEIQSMENIGNLDKFFMRWIQLQVAHRIGQDILTSKGVLAASILPQLGISSVTAKYPSGSDRQMDSWEWLLRSQNFRGFDIEAAINVIKQRISSSTGTSCHTIFQRFQSPSFQPTEFSGDLHCEIILVLLAILVQGSHISDSDDLGRLAQDLDHAVISVPKACCPVCWDALKYLRAYFEQNSDFVVRGRHCVLSPVELPYLLPHDVLANMTTRYKEILQDEIIKMMHPSGSPSDLQSDDGWPTF